ncbi:serine hydrolase domain-containing protein [Nocardioides sp. Root190]|uniref:serine hydrolase domain-containing protein n=1 Tax=Nocardioides sp. Root190 TaxID=1736488 RepID=UPI000B08D9F1|nr:serine hydrolase domain-containing protein [Nocardioides sp. Root190]
MDLGDVPWGVAVVSGGEITTSSHRLPDDGDVEIGSVSKGVTGLVYCDALTRGSVSPEDRLALHLPLDGCPAGEVTLGALAQHRSGLPRLPAVPDMARRSWGLWRHRANPYGDTLAELLEQTRATKLGRPRASYSNLGFELLGHAVAAAEGTTYADLVRTRIADPLGLDSWYVPASAAELSPRAVAGTARGRGAEAWTGEALGPAGGIRSTLADLGTFAAALLDGTVPGSDALEPTTSFAGPAVRIGAAWLTTEVRGHVLTWHNGGTGGWRSWLGVDREAARAAVVVRATTRSVDRIGVDLLTR